jgi:hypothetical protein
LGDIWKGLARLEPVETAEGRVEIGFEFGITAGGRTRRFLPTWALYLLPVPEDAAALIVVNRGLTLTVFYATQLRCSFMHELPPEDLSPEDLAKSLRHHLALGGRIDDLFALYRALVSTALQHT